MKKIVVMCIAILMLSLCVFCSRKEACAYCDPSADSVLTGDADIGGGEKRESMTKNPCPPKSMDRVDTSSIAEHTIRTKLAQEKDYSFAERYNIDGPTTINVRCTMTSSYEMNYRTTVIFREFGHAAIDRESVKVNGEEADNSICAWKAGDMVLDTEACTAGTETVIEFDVWVSNYEHDTEQCFDVIMFSHGEDATDMRSKVLDYTTMNVKTAIPHNTKH